MSPRAFLAYREAAEEIDVTDLLGSISVPALVVHDTSTTLGDFSALAQKLASHIPGARFVATKDVASVVDEFLREGGLTPTPVAVRKERPEPGAFRTVLFTDLVGHTEMMSRLGDAKGRDVLREHERITREVLRANGGTEVKTMGDGFMASFGSVTKAVECAVALQKAIEAGNQDAESPLARAAGEGKGVRVRVGLNAGEPIEEDGDLFGATVILASRIAAKADGGEILVADTVRGLCSGKGFLFADRGEFVAKGFEEPVRVYEVSWRDG
jgi:class 3 adenylate cyclase